jgi:hypothetical protein
MDRDTHADIRWRKRGRVRRLEGATTAGGGAAAGRVTAGRLRWTRAVQVGHRSSECRDDSSFGMPDKVEPLRASCRRLAGVSLFYARGRSEGSRVPTGPNH